MMGHGGSPILTNVPLWWGCGNAGGGACVGQGVYEKPLYLPLSSAGNLNLL